MPQTYGVPATQNALGDGVPRLLLAALASRRRARGGRLCSLQRVARFLELPSQ